MDRRTDPAPILAGYRALLASPLERRRHRATTAAVTAVIPAWRGDQLLESAVDSFLAVAGPRSDVVVVADGAADGPHFQAVRRRPRTTVVHQRDGGASAARNTGITFADGEYVLFLDDDDELLPGFVDRAVATLGADATLGFAVPWHVMADEEDAAPDTALRWCPLGAGQELMTDTNVLGSSCAVVPRWILDEPWARFEPTNSLNSDREFLALLRRHGFGGAVVPVLGVRSVRLPTGLSLRHGGTLRPAALREIEGRARAREVLWATR